MTPIGVELNGPSCVPVDRQRLQGKPHNNQQVALKAMLFVRSPARTAPWGCIARVVELAEARQAPTAFFYLGLGCRRCACSVPMAGAVEGEEGQVRAPFPRGIEVLRGVGPEPRVGRRRPRHLGARPHPRQEDRLERGERRGGEQAPRGVEEGHPRQDRQLAQAGQGAGCRVVLERAVGCRPGCHLCQNEGKGVGRGRHSETARDTAMDKARQRDGEAEKPRDREAENHRETGRQGPKDAHRDAERDREQGGGGEAVAASSDVTGLKSPRLRCTIGECAHLSLRGSMAAMGGARQSNPCSRQGLLMQIRRTEGLLRVARASPRPRSARRAWRCPGRGARARQTSDS